jgi:hypothetical protein
MTLIRAATPNSCYRSTVTLSVDTVLVNPNIQAMIGARLFAFQQRPVLAALERGKEVEIKTNTFVLKFDLAGIDTAIGQLFECADNLPH